MNGGRWAANGLLALTAFAWGTTAPVFHALLQTWDAALLTAIRLMITAPLFLVWVHLAGVTSFWPRTSRARRESIVLGAMLAVFSITLCIGIQLTDPITAAIYSSGAPLVAALLDWLVNAKRPDGPVIIGIALAIVGGLLASIEIGAAATARYDLTASAWLLFAVITWPLCSMLLQRWLHGLSQLHRTALSFTTAAPIAVVLAVILVVAGVETVPPEEIDLEMTGLFAWSVLGTSIVGTYCWNIGVSRLGISVASMFLNFIPVVAVVVSMAFGIMPSIEQIVGGILVLAGVAVAQRLHQRLR